MPNSNHPSISSVIVRKAPAKINLSLRIDGKLSDSFHFVRTLICPLELADTVQLVLTPSDKTAIELGLEFSGLLRACLEAQGLLSEYTVRLSSSDNLVLKAAEQFIELVRFPPQHVLRIALEKSIPSEAGLGGGSSDAAQVLLGLNELFGNPLNFNQLLEVAGRIGSDVAGCLSQRIVLAWGKGEKICPLTVRNTQCLSLLGTLGVILLKPPLGSPTAQAYQSLKRSCEPENGYFYREFAQGGLLFQETLRDLEEFGLGLDLKNNALDGTSMELTSNTKEATSGCPNLSAEGFLKSARFHNDFEPWAFAEIEALRKGGPASSAPDLLLSVGAERLLLCGSGSAVAGFFINRETADRAHRELVKKLPEAWFSVSTCLVPYWA